ncbi:MAG: site-2 protease family protein [Candidatus Doudnabacteria bacterium CG10_big_fil_rev_8_21_14_0_10_42_18]|uniref:Site-2 protease family protein n=1 Tax=Candidatus Doudnabacteria bacterium CG10_big_fil_rev_8_21_14_0_10_42_18 TaxID=1974552 RepID=A0A2H0VDS2_9BACT|nr:MAG: site-2 protease family protein [Candidatus Doudnabacteria bacterium CG10_big_fil_rev_8_21_14_0_10_42_18]
MDIIIVFVILIFSAIVHEVMHGVVAEKLGDSTARYAGRITLNPIPHIDPFGSILLPFILLAVGSPIIFGAAKPVPVNFNNLRKPKRDMALVSLAGPLSNFALAVLCVIPIKLGLANSISGPILIQAILINIILGTFNLIPIPPLDGSKILLALAPDEWMHKILSFERYGFMLVILFLFMGILDKILLPVLSLFGQIFGIRFF